VGELDAALGEAGREHGGTPVHLARNPAEPVGPVVDRVHGGDDRQQHLGGADVGRGAVTADVLLTGLQRQPVGGTALGVHRHTDQPAGQVPLEPGAHRHEGRVRPAVEHRDAEALGGADRDIDAGVPGASSTVSARGSDTATTMPPAACTASTSGGRSRNAPSAAW
jgi:hypothetical protein